MMLTAFIAYNGLGITEVLNIGADGMVLCLTEDERYSYIHENEIEIEWREA